MEEHNYTVYMHKNKINGKVYIGVTKVNVYIRWAKGNGYKNNKLFYNDILKYNWNNFEHILLFEHLTKEEAEQKEIELINQYKSNKKKYGYNINKGGFGKEKKEGNIVINVRIPIELKDDLKKEASKLSLSLSSYIRYKLSEMLKKEEFK